MIVNVQGLPSAISTLRRRTSLSSERIAAKVGVSASTVRRWESSDIDEAIRTQSTFVTAFSQFYAKQLGLSPKLKVL